MPKEDIRWREEKLGGGGEREGGKRNLFTFVL